MLKSRPRFNMSETTCYTTALLNVVLAGSSCWALRLVDPEELYFALTAFGLMLTNSAIGVFRYGHPDFGGHFKRVHDATSFMVHTYSVPLIVTEMYLQEEFIDEFLCYIHLASAVIPTIMYVMDKGDKVNKARDLVIATNIISLCYLSFTTNNHWGTALGVSSIMHYFGLEMITDALDIPFTDLYTVGFCFFNYFAIRSLFE